MTEKTSPEIERKLVTIISADVAEYSRLLAENEELTLKVFREHKVVFEQLVTLHRGRIFNTAGEAILAEFNSAVEQRSKKVRQAQNSLSENSRFCRCGRRD